MIRGDSPVDAAGSAPPHRIDAMGRVCPQRVHGAGRVGERSGRTGRGCCIGGSWFSRSGIGVTWWAAGPGCEAVLVEVEPLDSVASTFGEHRRGVGLCR